MGFEMAVVAQPDYIERIGVIGMVGEDFHGPSAITACLRLDQSSRSSFWQQSSKFYGCFDQLTAPIFEDLSLTSFVGCVSIDFWMFSTVLFRPFRELLLLFQSEFGQPLKVIAARFFGMLSGVLPTLREVALFVIHIGFMAVLLQFVAVLLAPFAVVLPALFGMLLSPFIAHTTHCNAGTTSYQVVYRPETVRT